MKLFDNVLSKANDARKISARRANANASGARRCGTLHAIRNNAECTGRIPPAPGRANNIGKIWRVDGFGAHRVGRDGHVAHRHALENRICFGDCAFDTRRCNRREVSRLEGGWEVQSGRENCCITSIFDQQHKSAKALSYCSVVFEKGGRALISKANCRPANAVESFTCVFEFVLDRNTVARTKLHKQVIDGLV